jgi:CBS domain containing-hemolysin-like protein
LNPTQRIRRHKKKYQTQEYSRMPVYKDSLDNIKGIFIHTKDLLAHLNKGDSFRWQTLIKLLIFVPKKQKNK